MTAELRVPSQPPYCCVLGEDGSECPEPAVYEVCTPPWTYDGYTHCCEKHLPDVKCDGDEVARLVPPKPEGAV